MTQDVFLNLFNRNMLGSRWIPIEELEALYKRVNIFADPPRVVVHAQEYSTTDTSPHLPQKESAQPTSPMRIQLAMARRGQSLTGALCRRRWMAAPTPAAVLAIAIGIAIIARMSSSERSDEAGATACQCDDETKERQQQRQPSRRQNNKPQHGHERGEE